MKVTGRLGIALLNCCGLLALFCAMLACSGATTPPAVSKPAAVPPEKRAEVVKAKPEREQIPVGSPVIIRSRGTAWAVDSPLVYARLKTFIDANDAQGQRDLIASGRAAQLDDGDRAKIISYHASGLVEIRVQTGEQKQKLWLIYPECLVDNRTKPDSKAE